MALFRLPRTDAIRSTVFKIREDEARLSSIFTAFCESFHLHVDLPVYFFGLDFFLIAPFKEEIFLVKHFV